jgi:23S rRNA (uracil1939-C5)-methyltransferase
MLSEREFELVPNAPLYGGDTLARLPDGRAVFIPYCLPGETVRIRVIEEKERYARAELLEVISSSTERRKPRCPHFGVCGGCHYQHINYEEQLRIKRSVLIDQFRRVGRIPEPPVNEMVPSPSEWNYRNHIQFHVAPNGQPGFLRQRSDQVIPIQECHLPEESLNQLWPALDLEYIPGLDRISLRVGREGQFPLLILESSNPQPIEFSVDFPLSALYQGPGGETVLCGDEYTVMSVHEIPFVVSDGAFFQVNTRVAELIVDRLLAILPLTRGCTVVDVYCGVGLFSAFFAPLVKKVIGIESHPAAANDFTFNLAKFDHVDLYQAPAEEVLPYLDLAVDIMMLDPPRQGIGRKALDGLLSLQPGVVAYLSCDPATLARDAVRLRAAGYDLVESNPFDMFPQTYHIESLNIFQRGSSEV